MGSDRNSIVPEPDEKDAPEKPVGETYIDEQGRTVTRYPARWAEGAVMRPYTGKPRRG